MQNKLETLYEQAQHCKKNTNYLKAIQYCNDALKLAPNHIDLLDLMGNCLVKANKMEAAQKCFFKIIQFQENNHKAHAYLSQIFWAQHNFHQAIYHGLQALPGYNNNSDFLYYLGEVFQRVKLYEQSIKYLEQSITCNANNPLAWNRLGMVHIHSGNLSCAEMVYREALKRYPDRRSLLINLGRCLDEQGLSHRAIEYYSKVAGKTELESQPRSTLLFALHYQSDLTPEYLLDAHKTWSNRTHKHRTGVIKTTSIHVGYVSTDFRMHPVGAFFYPILRHHDTQQFQIFCYSNVSDPDIITAKMKQLPVHWRNIVNLTDQKAVEYIQKDDIHILVDLGGHSDNNRLPIFAMKPAPVQASYLGYPGTTGLETIDYRITDHQADPLENKHYYTEKLVYMPHCFLCYHTIKQFPPGNNLPAYSNDCITFGSFNRLPKINNWIVKIWATIMKKVPNSRLICKSIAFRDKKVISRFLSDFESMGIHEGRIKLLDLTRSFYQHLACYHQVDIALDTYPYNGTTTTCEALLMGIPVITLEGRAHVSRVSSSILHNIGLTECIAKSPEKYIQTAIKLAQDLLFLSKLRKALPEMLMASPLFQWKNFVNALENHYREWLL